MGFLSFLNDGLPIVGWTALFFGVAYPVTALTIDHFYWSKWAFAVVLVILLAFRLLVPDGWNVLVGMFGSPEPDFYADRLSIDHWAMVRIEFWSALAGWIGGFFVTSKLR